MRLGTVDQIEVERELRLHLALPLLRKRCRRENQAPPHSPTDQKFCENEARFDRLTQTNVVCQQQRDARHFKGFQQWNELKIIDLHRAKKRRRDWCIWRAARPVWM